MFRPSRWPSANRTKTSWSARATTQASSEPPPSSLWKFTKIEHFKRFQNLNQIRLTLHFTPVEAWRAEERVLDGGESRPPVVSSVGRARRRGHNCGRLVGRLIGCVGGRRGRGGGAQQVSQADGRQVATSTPFNNTIFGDDFCTFCEYNQLWRFAQYHCSNLRNHFFQRIPYCIFAWYLKC